MQSPGRRLACLLLCALAQALPRLAIAPQESALQLHREVYLIHKHLQAASPVAVWVDGWALR
jgi:hypothetical protein